MNRSNGAIHASMLQDTMANMMVHRAEVSPREVVEVSRWSEWCLENTLSLLAAKFPGAAVWLVRPCRMFRSLYSCFHHFVTSSITGVPTYSSHHGALLHLQALLTEALEREREKIGLETSVSEALSLPLVVAGFSKGCVVLNQMTHELVNVSGGEMLSEITTAGESSGEFTITALPAGGYRDNQETPPTSSTTDDGGSNKKCGVVPREPLPLDREELQLLRQIVSRLKAFYWLDSGHSGESGAWVTESGPLRSLASLQIPVHVDVTPQQVRDPSREWIGNEEAEFVEKLRQFGAGVVVETLHFEHEDKSMENHFRVLQEFKP